MIKRLQEIVRTSAAVKEHHVITMSDEDFIDGFTTLMGRIHNVLGDNQPRNGGDIRSFQSI